ncbi:MAG: RNA polymerase sigma-54 factor [Acidobacteria bacterium]|nr:MAG: RNA polymerase sigma-54 factor [Acidobacteriota bacterium]
MALEQKLSLKLAQKLVMTPSLQQAIKLLQMTRLELEGVLTEELEENPVLEEGELSTDDGDGLDDGGEALELEAGEAEAETAEAMDDIDLEAYFSDYAESWEGGRQASTYEERQGPPLENTLTREPDLYDHLMWQLRMSNVPPLTREIAELIIGNLDADGFLAATIEEIMAMGADGFVEPIAGGNGLGRRAEPAPGAAPQEQAAAAVLPEPAAQAAEEAGGEAAAEDGGSDGGEAAEADPPGYPRHEVEAALELVRSFDPPGVASRDLQECLLRQLDARGEPEDSLARRLIADKWPELKRRKFEAIARSFGVALEDLRPAVELVRSLETRPGRAYNNERTQYVEPDVYVVKVGDQYVVQLNDDGLPRLRVSRAYRRLLKEMRREGRQADAQQFLKEKMRSAMWLIKSLDQRQRTIYKVTQSIVQQQRAFLDHGIEHLRPMVLRDVAEDINMHESTVSRVVSNKYVHTPRGLIPLKFFFHSGIDREYGGDISSLTVKRKIQQLVQEEDPKKPLSDSELMRILKREGIQIARRTVAKYRDELRIPSSTERKQVF